VPGKAQTGQLKIATKPHVRFRDLPDGRLVREVPTVRYDLAECSDDTVSVQGYSLGKSGARQATAVRVWTGISVGHFSVAENSLREAEKVIGNENIAAYYHELVTRIAAQHAAH
jgi:hypothetical protein